MISRICRTTGVLILLFAFFSGQPAAADNNAPLHAGILNISMTDGIDGAGACVKGGDIIVYRIHIDNMSNPFTTTPIQVCDQLPAGVDFVSISGAGYEETPNGQLPLYWREEHFFVDGINHRVTWTIPYLPPFSIGMDFSLTVQVKTDVEEGVTLVNTCAVALEHNEPEVLTELTTTCGNIGPVARCMDITVPADMPACQAYASVDAGSYDPDGGPVTMRQEPEGPYPVGHTTVTLTVTDAREATASCTAEVTVRDASPPALFFKKRPLLFSNSHRYSMYTVTDMLYKITDDCDGPLDVSTAVIVLAWSDEPEDAPGSGDLSTRRDILISPDCQTIFLRDERNLEGNGRVYTVLVQAEDRSGNIAVRNWNVLLPVQVGQNVINDGPSAGYVVFSACSPMFKSAERVSEYPEEIVLLDSYPNPFTEATTIRYTMPAEGHARLAVYDVFGRIIETLVDGPLDRGIYTVSFAGRDLASGTYFARLETNGVVVIRHITLAR